MKTPLGGELDGVLSLPERGGRLGFSTEESALGGGLFILLLEDDFGTGEGELHVRHEVCTETLGDVGALERASGWPEAPAMISS